MKIFKHAKFQKFPQSPTVLSSSMTIIMKPVLNVHSGTPGKDALVPDSTKRKIVSFSVGFHVRYL